MVSQTPPNDPLYLRIAQRLNPIFQDAIDNRKVPAVTAIVLNKDGKVLYGNGVGRTTIDKPDSPEATIHSINAVQSLAKLATCTAFFQLLEQDKVDLHDPVAKHVPEIKEIQVLRGFNDDGSPRLSSPATPPTILHLLTHTAGFSYDFFNLATLRWRISAGSIPASYGSGSKAAFMTPLMFDPGTQHEYGINIDWLGFLIERITGQNLGEYVEQHISQPLGLKNMVATLSEEQAKDFMTLHVKDSAGTILVMPPIGSPAGETVKTPGGHFLQTSAHDYAQFLLTILHKGTHPVSGVQILKSTTVEKYYFKDWMPEVGITTASIGSFESAIPQLTCAGEMLPGVSKGFSLAGLLINKQDLVNGRPAGSVGWAGLDNSFYWIDPVTGIVAVFLSAVFPFFDRDILHLYDAMERVVYDKPAASSLGKSGSNFEGGIITVPPYGSEAS